MQLAPHVRPQSSVNDVCPISLDAACSTIFGRVQAGERALVLLEFDEVLAPQRNEGGDDSVPANVIECLKVIARSDRAVVGVLSGQSLSDLMSRVGIDGLVYAGNHGLEIRGRGLNLVDPFAFLLEPALRQIVDELMDATSRLRSLRLQNKRLTATVHFSAESEEDWDFAGETCRRVLERHPQFQLSERKGALDILPRTDWNKGAAVDWISGQLGMKDAVLVYVGADGSDEQAFEALPEAITVKVGGGLTKACSRAQSPGEVWTLLDLLADALGRS